MNHHNSRFILLNFTCVLIFILVQFQEQNF